jgi:spore germination protein
VCPSIRWLVVILTFLSFELTSFKSTGAPFESVAFAASRLEHWGFYVMYDPASRSSLVQNIDQLDDVVPDYFGVSADGTIAGSDDPSIDAIVRANGKHLLPLVQNRVRYSDLSPLLSDPMRRQTAASAIADLTARFGYDGITLDFEGVSPADRSHLTSLIRTLADDLHAKGKLLAVAVPAKSGEMSNGWAGAFDYSAIGASADRAILMAYGFRTASSSKPGPISPLPWVENVNRYALSAIPGHRLVLGIGVWGYDWNLSQPARATTLRYAQAVALVDRYGGQVRVDASNGAASYTYQTGGQDHAMWFENTATVEQKIATAAGMGDIGVAFWRLGQEAPGVWHDLRGSAEPDFAVPNGWFFSETGGGTGLGYRVTDDDGIHFWSEFRRLGGVAVLGYPSSRRYVGSDGFVYQVFQRGVLQWRPELGVAYFSNTFEQLTAAGWDPKLAQLGIPEPIQDDGSGGNWNRARKIRLAWLTNSAIAAAFYANPNPTAIKSWSVDRSIQLYGLPASRPVKSGPFIVQRFQRVSLQLWVEDVPGMPAKGSVVGILGGDLYKQAGLVPATAAAPELPRG